MIHTAIQLKAKVRNLSGGDNKIAMTLIRTFFMERFLERISLSRYKDQFVLKGGMLVSSLIGMNARATMDIDTTVQALPLTKEDIDRIVTDICDIHLDDNISFSITYTETIMDDFDYPGIRVHILGHMDQLQQPIKIDISTDDVITPGAITYDYQLMFEERTIKLRAYNTESLLAEKTQTILARGLANTRMRDFYDVYEITLKKDFSEKLFNMAFQATCAKRGTFFNSDQIRQTINLISESDEMNALWKQFIFKNKYTSEIQFGTALNALQELLKIL
jgi:predicted nucleotidyltransferase component of viral defense system